MPVTPDVLDAVFKAYDVRGLVDVQLDEQLASAVGAAVAVVLGEGAGAVVVGHDMRPSSRPLVEAFAGGVTEQGLDVVDIGLASTDMLYFASGTLDLPGAMFTASHNPAGYNGIKLCRGGAAPVAAATGLDAIRDLVADGGPGPTSAPRGRRVRRDVLDDFAEHVRGFADTSGLDGLRVVVDAGNGMAGHVLPAVVGPTGLVVDELYFELDGTFPNHPADPLDPANLEDLRAAVVERGAALGLAFDGDADRVFAVDERGEPVSSSLVGAVVAERVLRREPGATVLHNLICSRTVPETIERAGGTAVRTKVGHSLIKQRMAETGAVYGCEHSGHHYFRDNFRADSGLIAAVVLLEAVAEADGPLSSVVAPYDRYVQSGERNHEVADVEGVIDAVRAALAAAAVEHDDEDGLTMVFGDGWFNLRPSNTEPLLRLNVEGDTVEARDRILAEVERLIAHDG